jgi:hypothetical protein
MCPSYPAPRLRRAGNLSTNIPKQSGRFAKHVGIPRESDPDELFALTPVVPEKMIPREDKDAVRIENLLECPTIQWMIDAEPGHTRKRALTRRQNVPARFS